MATRFRASADRPRAARVKAQFAFGRTAQSDPHRGADLNRPAVIGERQARVAVEVEPVEFEPDTQRLAEAARPRKSSSSQLRRPRRRRIAASPATGSSARMSAAVPTPAASLLTLRQNDRHRSGRRRRARGANMTGCVGPAKACEAGSSGRLRFRRSALTGRRRSEPDQQ